MCPLVNQCPRASRCMSGILGTAVGIAPWPMWEGSAGVYEGLTGSQPVWGRNGGPKDRLLPPASRARCALPAAGAEGVNTARGLYQRWCELLQGERGGPDARSWTGQPTSCGTACAALSGTSKTWRNH